nr:uncharacterized protein LOC118877446 isoform X1 [Drosophila suzukii]
MAFFRRIHFLRVLGAQSTPAFVERNQRAGEPNGERNNERTAGERVRRNNSEWASGSERQTLLGFRFCFSVLAANKGDIEMGCWALRRGQKSGEIDETTTCDGGLDIYTYRGMDAVEASPTASVGQLMATTAAHVWVWKPRLWRRLCDPLMVMVTLVTVSSTRRNPASRRYRRKQTPWE